MSKKMVGLSLVVVALAVLSGCAPASWAEERAAEQAVESNDVWLQPAEILLKDGRTVVCVKYVNYGVSCDWEGLRDGQ